MCQPRGEKCPQTPTHPTVTSNMYRRLHPSRACAIKNAHAYAAKQTEKGKALGQRIMQWLFVCETSIDHPADASEVPLFEARRLRAFDYLTGIVEINDTSEAIEIAHLVYDLGGCDEEWVSLRSARTARVCGGSCCRNGEQPRRRLTRRHEHA